jgi:hypothetical protein
MHIRDPEISGPGRNLGNGNYGFAAVAELAAAGSTQADASVVTSGWTIVSAADATKGVKLPAAVKGMQIQVKNDANAILKVYPATGGTINSLSANAALSMAAHTTATFTAVSSTRWVTSPLVPS